VTCSDDSSYYIYRRYREFDELNSALEKRFPIEAGSINYKDRTLLTTLTKYVLNLTTLTKCVPHLTILTKCVPHLTALAKCVCFNPGDMG